MPRSVLGRMTDGMQYGGFITFASPTGKVFYVSNATSGLPGIAGSDGNDGKTPEKPKKTLAGALAQCLAGRDDTIILMSGHAETISTATAVNVNIAGVNVVGMGEDSDRPTFTLTTVAGATFTLSGANATLSNILIVDNVGATVAMTLAGKGVRADKVEIRDGSSSYTTGISVVGGGSNLADHAKITNCFLYSAGATNGILLAEIDDQVIIDGCEIIGEFSAAGMLASVVLTNLRILNSDVHNVDASAGYGIRASAAATGMVARCNAYVGVASHTIITASNMSHLACWGATSLNAASALV